MKWDALIFLETEDVDLDHEAAIQLGGGSPGKLNPGLIESATMTPRTGYYSTLAEIAAVYAYGLAKNHGYQDGNKRTATLAMLTFLAANGHPLELGPEWIGIMEGVADGTVDRSELTTKLADLMGGDVPIET